MREEGGASELNPGVPASKEPARANVRVRAAAAAPGPSSSLPPTRAPGALRAHEEHHSTSTTSSEQYEHNPRWRHPRHPQQVAPPRVRIGACTHPSALVPAGRPLCAEGCPLRTDTAGKTRQAPSTGGHRRSRAPHQARAFERDRATACVSRLQAGCSDGRGGVCTALRCARTAVRGLVDLLPVLVEPVEEVGREVRQDERAACGA